MDYMDKTFPDKYCEDYVRLLKHIYDNLEKYPKIKSTTVSRPLKNSQNTVT